jgi:hypothetical protein
MLIKVKGKRYNFEILSQDNEKDVCFYIRAVCRYTRRTSCINNLNAVLSAFNVNPLKEKYADSMWEIPKSEANRLFSIGRKILRDRIFLNYLEDKLDEDRLEGEWDNVS